MPATGTNLPAPGASGSAVPAAAGNRLPRSTAIMVLVGVAPLLIVMLTLTWRHPAYRFFPLAWLGALWLMRRAWRELSPDLVPGTRVGATVLLGIAWGVTVVASVFWSAWGGAVAAALAVAALAWWAGGWPVMRAFLPGLVVLVLAVPPPLGLDVRLLAWLGHKSLSAASRLLHDLPVVHFVGGETLEVPRLQIPLAALLSLANAIPALAAFAVFYAAALRRPLWRGVVMIPFATGFTLAAANLTSVYAVRASAAITVDLFAGFRGWLLLLAVALVAAVLVASLDQALEFLFSPIRGFWNDTANRVDRRGPAPRLTAPVAAAGPGRWAGWAFLAVGLAQLPLAGLSLRHEFSRPPPLVSRLPANARLEPPAIEGWKLLAAAPLYLPLPPTNASTRGVWYYESGELAASVVLDYPVSVADDPVAAYEKVGWRIAERRQRAGGPRSPGPWTDGIMQRERFQVAAYWVARLSESGRWLGTPPRDYSLVAPFRGPARSSSNLRLCVLAVADDAPSSVDLERLERLFESVRAAVGQQFLAQLSAP